MIVTTGLFNRMVLQRDKSSRSRACFAGTCQAAGIVQARVRAGGKTLRGWNWRNVGSARRGRMAGRITGLPAGGPYDIDLRVISHGQTTEDLSVRDVLVGDVWVLAGQSNMAGTGRLSDRLRPMPMVRVFYMHDEWDVAVDPLHTLWCAVDPVHGGEPNAPRLRDGLDEGTGPAVAFGQEMYKRTAVPQGLIACAHGGTSMSQWDPALKKLGGRSLYGAMCRRVGKNGGSVAGVFWYQGCSETSPEAAGCYTERMARFVQSIRRDLGNPRLPVVAVQIGRYHRHDPGAEYWNSIRQQQRLLPAKVAHLAVVPAIDLPMDDVIHISGKGQHVLGKRSAAAMLVLREGRKAGLPPIDVRDVAVRSNPVTRYADIHVQFKNVVGALQSKDAPTGFFVDSRVRDSIPFRIDLQKDTAILQTFCAPEMLDGQLYYGHGLDPYCNITDAAERPVPAFGPLPMPMATPRAVTPFVTRLRVSQILPAADLRKLGCPGGLKLETRRFEGILCDRHAELVKAGDALVYYAVEFRCAKAMKLNLLLGYDGPVKAWVDGRAIFCDPEGAVPARPEDATVPFAAKAGKHEILVGLGTKGAWGIYLRLERTDVSKAILRRSPQSVVMPEVLG